ncbi:hypothetical protein [Nostoc sp.]|uniref:hypothetical protein n=1 Tax=Nostoc sp. TaxID=1180 RepID=UPI002FF83B85
MQEGRSCYRLRETPKREGRSYLQEGRSCYRLRETLKREGRSYFREGSSVIASVLSWVNGHEIVKLSEFTHSTPLEVRRCSPPQASPFLPVKLTTDTKQ